MTKRYVGLCLLLLTSNLALSDVHVGPPHSDCLFPDESPLDIEPPKERTQTPQEKKPLFIVTSEKKTKLVQSFQEAFGNLTKGTEEELEAVFAQNKKTTAQLLTEYQETVKQNKATVIQSQQKMNDDTAQALSEHQEALDQQKQMSIEEREAVKRQTHEKITHIMEQYDQSLTKHQAVLEQNSATVAQSQQEMNAKIAQALSEHQEALDQQEKMNEERIAEILGRYDKDKAEFLASYNNDKVEFIRTQLLSKEAKVTYKEALIAKGNKWNTGGIATVGVGAVITSLSILSKFATKGKDHPNAILARGIGVLVLGVGACLPHTDTKTMQADVDHTQGSIEKLEAMLARLKPNAEGSQEKAAPAEDIQDIIVED